MNPKRETLVLFCLCRALEAMYSDPISENIPKDRETVVLLACQAGRSEKIQAWEVENILNQSVAQLLFGK